MPEVRELFAKKLHKGLSKGIPHKCLPLDFMGFYALGGREVDRHLNKLIKTYVDTDVGRRREYLKTFASGKLNQNAGKPIRQFSRIPQLMTNINYHMMVFTVEKGMHQLPHILPDYMLVFAVPVLTHDPTFTAADDPLQLKQIEKCLWLILEPLISNKEFFCYGFYKNLVERMKNHKDALKSEDELTNHVRYD